MGWPGRSATPHCCKPAKASTMCLQRWKQPLDVCRRTPCFTPRTPSWALRCNSCGNTVPQRELSQRVGLISKTAPQTHGPESTVVSGYNIPPHHAPASEKTEQYNGLLKMTLKTMGGGTFKHGDLHLAKASWLVNTRGSTSQAGSAQSKLLCTVEGDKVPVVCMRNVLGNTVWTGPAFLQRQIHPWDMFCSRI